MIKVKPFGKENMAALPEELIGGLFIFGNIYDLIKCLHFDNDYPENKNVRLKDRGVCEVFGGRKWKEVSLDTACKMLVVQACDIFREYYESNMQRIIEEDINEYDLADVLEHLSMARTGSDEESIKDLYDEVRGLFTC